MSSRDPLILTALAAGWETRIIPRLSGYPGEVCWEWEGAKDSYGYGTAALPKALTAGKTMIVRVHRVVWLALRGEIPAGLVLDHDNPEFGCQNRACAYPGHLEVTTRASNCSRNGQSRRTHCPAGHPLVEGNLTAGPGRKCLTCSRTWGAAQSKTLDQAAKATGLTVRDYRKIHGYSVSTAREFINGGS